MVLRNIMFKMAAWQLTGGRVYEYETEIDANKALRMLRGNACRSVGIGIHSLC